MTDMERWEIGEERFWLTNGPPRIFTTEANIPEDEPAEYLVPIDASDGSAVALAYDDHYAHLIAQAPAMRAALRALVGQIDRDYSVSPGARMLTEQARAILRAVEGSGPTTPAEAGSGDEPEHVTDDACRANGCDACADRDEGRGGYGR